MKTPHSPLSIISPSIIPQSVHGGKCRKACLRTQTSFIRSSTMSRNGEKPQIAKKLIEKLNKTNRTHHLDHQKNPILSLLITTVVR